MPQENMTIFVFGSNLAGRHGMGAALAARRRHGAIYGQGEGRQGASYAIPTKDKNMKTLPVNSIQLYVNKFIQYAKENPHLTFKVTPIGTGLAGYKHEHMAPLFKNAPNNCILPKSWLQLLGHNK